MPDDPRDALLAEGDRLARTLVQSLSVTLADQARLVFLGRSLVYNLVLAFLPTLEQITRRAGAPLHAELTLDDRTRPALSLATADGVVLPSLPVDDLVQRLLYLRGRLHPNVFAHLQSGLEGDEHHATQALIRCLRSKPVLDGMQREIQHLLREAAQP